LIDPQADKGGGAWDPEETLVLRVWPTLLDEVALFDPLDPSLRPRLSGDKRAWSESEYPSLSFAFRIPRGEEPRHVWLRIETQSTRRVHVDLHTLESLWKVETRQQLVFSVYLGAMLLFLGFAVLNWFVEPDRLVSAFLMRQASALAFGLSYLGYLRIALDGWIPVLWINDIGNVLLFLAVLTGVWFEYVFLSELNLPRWARLFMRTILTVLSCLMLLVLARVQLALDLLFLTLALLPVAGLLIALTLTPSGAQDEGVQPLLPRSVLVVTYAVRVVLMSLAVVPTLGLFETTAMPLSSVMLQQLLVGLLMAAVLYVRTKRHILKRTHAVTQLAIAQEHASRERAHREEHQKLLAMLAHELKTPLAAMKMLVSLRTTPPNANATLHRMLADMNHVIERCLQSVRTHEPTLALQLQVIDVPLCVRLTLARTADPDRIEVTCPALLNWHTDAQVFQMVMGNLLDNAMKYSPVGSVVQLGVETTEAPQRGLRLWVENEEGAAGAPDLAQVFEKYYRNPLARRHSGSGLGLYLTQVFVKALGGSVECSVANRRVRFELWLPN
ncbi:ATP-binding protein, partial [Hydrogenophaga sp.]|uniref:sensor histidine kinase n=1 Tax=Hydrogenophaga sp. TaxID=1904254 RepID=UPI003AF981BB